MSDNSQKEETSLTPVSISFVEAQALSIADAVKRYSSSLSTGLSTKEAERRLEVFGPNELSEPPGETIFEKILEQLSDTMVQLLLGAAVISFLISIISEREEHDLPAWVEPSVIFMIIVMNTLVGIYQDYNAERSMENLKKLQSKVCEVLRDGEFQEVPSTTIVPGDIVRLKVGDVVPADCRVLKLVSPELKVDESIFTGEPEPASKDTEPIPASTQLADSRCMLFSASVIQQGISVSLVAKTGEITQLGKIKKSVQEAAESDKDNLSPLKKQLADFGKTLTTAISIICLVIWLISVPKFFDAVHGSVIKAALYYFKQAVALGVAAIPEGLPAVITTCLALGTIRMVRKNAVVRKLNKVETLGCTTVICSDKTGTLTRNEMFASKFFLLGENASPLEWTVKGVGYSFDGAIEPVNHTHTLNTQAARIFVESCLVGNEAKVIDGKPRGMVTECALIALSSKIKRSRFELEESNFEKVFDFPFTGFRKMSSCIVRDLKTGSTQLLSKGAAEVLVDKCSRYIDAEDRVRDFSAEERKRLIALINEKAAEGFRMLGVAYRDEKDFPKMGELKDSEDRSSEAFRFFVDQQNVKSVESEMIFVGYIAISDPVRAEVPEAVRKCREAGINVFMITGDKKETAEAIGKQIGFGSGVKTFLGSELDQLSALSLTNELKRAMANKQSIIFARVNPDHKKTIVKALLALEEIVAMTGDGVNDAPALKTASIGIAMGITGTDVAKEASDIILLDDNFSSIINAIEEGRTIYANMKAFIKYMISSNIGEVVSIFLTSFLGIPEGFNSIQLLWVNLVTDGVPATALSFNPPEADIMSKNPRKKTETLLNRNTLIRFFVIGTYVGLATVGIFIYYYTNYDWSGDSHRLVSYSHLSNWTKCRDWEANGVPNACNPFSVDKAKPSTLSLTVLVVIEMFNSLNATSENLSLFTVGLFANKWLLKAIGLSMFLHCLVLYLPFLNKLFSVVPLSFKDWILVIAFSLPVILIEEVLKLYNRVSTEAEKFKHKRED